MTTTKRDRPGPSKPIPIRFTDAERAELEASAASQGLTVSAFVRMRALREPSARPPRITRQERIDMAAVGQLLTQVNRIGGNLHQLVKSVNFGETPAGAEVRQALAGLKEVATACMTALGRVPK